MSAPRPPIRIANCSGFFGDRPSAAAEMLDGGPIDVLTGDWLAELTMLILYRTRRKRPDGGYARTFVGQLEGVMGRCLDRGIRVVSNAGGLDPAGCARAVHEVAERLGLHPTIAYVTGDDLVDRLPVLTDDGLRLHNIDTGAPLTDPTGFVTANAYLGCWGVVDALDRGADIVITGRTTDAALVCAPAAWHHGWKRDDWDRLAGAVAAGHVIECGTQATGGNYSFFTEIADMTRAGFPWAEIADDGSAVIGKHDGTGGEVSLGTVVSQLLYEIAGPRYLGPDVTTRFDTAQLEQMGRDRVRISGTRGEPPPPTLKVALNRIGGYRNDIGVAIPGLDVEAKAELVERAFWAACPLAPSDLASVTTRLVRRDKPNPVTNDEAVAEWWLTVKDPDESKVGRAVSNAVAELFLSTIPGFYLVSGMPAGGRMYGVYTPSTIPAVLVPQSVAVLGGDSWAVTSVAPEVSDANPGDDRDSPAAGPPLSRETVHVPLGAVVGARSGDKGGNANLGVFARSESAWAWLDGYLTGDRLGELLPEAARVPIQRYRLPNLRSLNFVLRGFLEEGAAASSRSDGQAKSLAEWLRARMVDVPRSVLDEAGR